MTGTRCIRQTDADGISYGIDLTHKKRAFSFFLYGRNGGSSRRQAVISQLERIDATDGTATANGCTSMAAAKRLLGVRIFAA